MNPDTLVDPLEEETGTLTALDRCDRCGAQAYVAAQMMSGILLFCGHHWHEYKDGISKTVVGVVDETYRLLS